MENGTLTHYIDGGGIDEPAGWEEFTEDLERNFDQRIIATAYPIEVTFTGGANETLRAIYLENFCATVTYEVDFHCQGSTYRVVRGIVSLADVEWNLNRCTAKVKVQDDGYGARIFNNKDIGVYPTATTTKNGLALTAVTPIALEVFDPTAAAGTYLVDTREAYDWLACMVHMIGYITDNELTVQSNWYDGLPDDERFALVYGRELRVADGSSLAPQYSFKDLFANAWKKYNLWAYVARTATGAPVLRIETEPDTYGTSTAIAMLNQDDLLQSIDTDLLYAKVAVGSEDYIKSEDGAFAMPFLSLQGFVKEEFHLLGTCNTDAVLDLVSSFVIDTNEIEDSAINNSNDKDEDIFLIQYDQSTSRAVKGDYLIPGGPPFLYNEQLLNVNVLNRWPLQAAVSTQFDTLNAAFRATNYANQNFFSPFAPAQNITYTDAFNQDQYSNDYSLGNFDPSNSWGNGTPPGTPVSVANSRYTAGNTGFYQFELGYTWTQYLNFVIPGPPLFGIWTSTASLTGRLNRYSAANVLLSSQDVVSTHVMGGTSSYDAQTFFTDIQVFNQVLNVGDYVEFESSVTYRLDVVGSATVNEFSFIIWEGSYARTSFVASGGGDLSDVDADEYKATKYTFDRHSNTAEWIALRDDPTQNVVVATDDTSLRTTYPLKVSRNIASGATKWENIADRNQPFK